MLSLRRRALTLEASLFLGILVVACGIRLGWVYSTPLDPSEAMRAVAAWRLQAGLPPDWWDAPLFVLLQTAAFILFGSSDASARLPSLLAGVGGIATLWLFRPYLGRWPVLVTAAFLAVSPSAAAAGSQAREESLALVITLLLGWQLLSALNEEAHRYQTLSAFGVAALLTLGYPGVTGLLVLLLYALAATTVRSLRGRPVASTRLLSYQALAAIPAALFLITTGLLQFMPGAGLPSLVAWTQHFEPTWEPYPWYRAWLFLAASDLPALCLGAPMAVAALVRWASRDPSPEDDTLAFFALWGLMGLGVILLSTEGGLSQLALVTLPFTILAGYQLANGLRLFSFQVMRQGWANLAAAALLLLFAGLVLLQNSVRPNDGLFSPRTLALLALVAAVLAVSPIALRQGSRPISALTMTMVSLLVLVHSLTTLAMPGHWPGAAQVNPAIVTALTQLTATSPYTTVGPAPQIAVAGGLNYAVAWPLRRVAAVNFGAEPPPEATVIVASEAAAQGIGSGYQTSPLTLVETKNFQEWRSREVWRWLIFGELATDPAATQRATLLVRF